MRRVRHYERLAMERFRYHRNRRRHQRLYEPDPARAPDEEVMASFAEDGVVIVREFLPAAVIQQIVAEVRQSAEALAENRYGGPLKTKMADGGLVRLYEVEKSLSPSSRAFFDNAFIAGLADATCRNGMHSADRYLDYKAEIDGLDKNLLFHIDHWKVRFKAFLLLEDVTEDQAPFVYVLGSHRHGRWRRKWDWGYQHNPPRDDRKDPGGNCLLPDEVAEICGRYGFEERTFTGKAGDLILADTRGIHRGSPLRSGTRLQLVELFVMNGAPEYAC
jgi:hypothetical protein